MENENKYTTVFPEEYDDQYESYEDKIGTLPLRSAIKIVSDIFAQYGDDRDDTQALSLDLSEFIQQLLSQDEISGDADDWHNLAVDIARKDYYNLSCDLLEEGLRRFPSNADLLGDYLQYGPSCSRIEQCKIYYKQLAKLPKVKYTWRSFHFSVSWLTHLWKSSESQKEMDKLHNEMLSLVKQYREYFPNSEDSYVCEANVHKLTKKFQEEKAVLQTAVSSSFLSPKCALRLADKHFEEGKYADSLEMVQKSLRDANQVQASVNEAYLYYLSGLARISLSNSSDNAPSADTVIQIYRDFEDSLRLGVRRSFEDSICKKTSLLYRQYREDIPDDCSKLYDLLDSHDML